MRRKTPLFRHSFVFYRIIVLLEEALRIDVHLHMHRSPDLRAAGDERPKIGLHVATPLPMNKKPEAMPSPDQRERGFRRPKDCYARNAGRGRPKTPRMGFRIRPRIRANNQ